MSATPVGPASVGLAYRDLADRDLRAELRIGVPAAVVVLLLVFGSLVAAALPLLVAAVSIAVALALAIVGTLAVATVVGYATGATTEALFKQHLGKPMPNGPKQGQGDLFST